MPPKTQVAPQNFSDVLLAIDNQNEKAENDLLNHKREHAHKIKSEINIIGNIQKISKNPLKERNTKSFNDNSNSNK